MVTPTAKRLLIVEDDARLRAVLAQILRRRGFECEVARDGEDGLARMRSEPFDLVITDMRMPHKTGLEMIVAARAELPISPRFILLSGFHDHPVEVLYEAGASKVLTKPLPPQELSAHVSELLAQA